MKKRFILRKEIVRVLCAILFSYLFFVAVTIDSIGNATYDKILVIGGLVALGSFALLKKFSRVFDEN